MSAWHSWRDRDRMCCDMVNLDAFYGKTTTPYDKRIFDFDLFDHLTMGDFALQEEVINLFRLQIQSSLDTFGMEPDGNAWRMNAHTLKGAAAAVGAVRIAVQAESWERSGDMPSDLSAARSLLEALAGQYFAEVERVFKPLADMQQAAALRAQPMSKRA
jgi:HPt (histidine-containing phosphotransfer) domain-containing protein